MHSVYSLDDEGTMNLDKSNGGMMDCGLGSS